MLELKFPKERELDLPLYHLGSCTNCALNREKGGLACTYRKHGKKEDVCPHFVSKEAKK